MTTSLDQMTELALRLKITKKAAEKLAHQAAESGQPIDDYASELLEQAIAKPTVDELLAPIREDFARSGMSEAEIMDLGRRELDALRQERKAKRE